MKLSKKELVLISFMLFSLFFGAGNLIFPPFLGQSAGNMMPIAIAGFLLTAVILPVLGVVVVAKCDGLDKLAGKVNHKFALIFTIVVYLSIGPGLGIPRAASVPFEMAISPLLPDGSNISIFMFLYSFVFFMIALWLALTPNKLVERIGKFLTPSLLTLIVLLFVGYLFKGEYDVGLASGDYSHNAFIKGFLEGYNTMDTIAALNFGLVISITLRSFQLEDKKDIIRYTIIGGIFAGCILSGIYLMLSYVGMGVSGVIEPVSNGALILRYVVNDIYGYAGSLLLAAIFTLACLTTCVGLINSISSYFSTLFKRISYKAWVFIIVGFSFLVCNQGLDAILSLSVPVLNAIYPISIVLIVLGLFDQYFKNNKMIYPVTIALTAIVSLVYVLGTFNITLGFITNIMHLLPLYSMGMGWVSVAFVSIILCSIIKK